jgi:hypothetical protein
VTKVNLVFQSWTLSGYPKKYGHALIDSLAVEPATAKRDRFSRVHSTTTSEATDLKTNTEIPTIFGSGKRKENKHVKKYLKGKMLKNFLFYQINYKVTISLQTTKN